MPRCGQFAEDRTEPSAGLMGLRGPHLPASRSATDKAGDAARADNWRNPEGVSALGHLSASLLSHSPFLGMLLRPSADVRLRDLTRDRAEFFNSLLEPVKKLQSAALLLDFWLGQGVRAVAIPAACCRCFASPFELPSAGCLPSIGCAARATQAKPKRHATLWARARQAVWLRCPLGYSPLRGCALACALPYGLSCSRAALSNFFTGSKRAQL